MAGSGKRRSTRLSALEDTRIAKQVRFEDYEAFFENDENFEQAVGPLPEHGPKPGSTKRDRKKRMRSVDKVVEDNSIKSMEVPDKAVVSDQADQTLERENHSRSSSQPSPDPSASQMPDKQRLQLVIDILQKRDSHSIFAKPVDSMEVKDYYGIIKDPMDFGTLKDNLEQGLYKSLEKFEHDVFLIFENAMYFNDATTIFYKQARAIKGLATKVFHTLRTDPENLESEYSLARKRPVRKSSTGARTTPRASNGTRQVRGSNNTPVVGACSTYRPLDSFRTESESLISEISNCSNPLIPKDFTPGRYRKSLLQFAEGLGPIAQMVVKRKLQRLEASESTPPNSVKIESSPVVANSAEGLDIHDAPRSTTSDIMPVEGESYLAMMLDACKSDNEESLSKNNTHGSYPLPYEAEAMRASSSSQIRRFSIDGMESQPKDMVARGPPNYGVQDFSTPNLVLPQSLSGQNGVSSQMESQPKDMVARGAPNFGVQDFSTPNLVLPQSFSGQNRVSSQMESQPKDTVARGAPNFGVQDFSTPNLVLPQSLSGQNRVSSQMESQPKDMVACGTPNYGVQDFSTPSLVLPQSLPGQNRVSSQSYASNISLQAGVVTEQNHQRSLVSPTIGLHQRTIPNLSFGASSSQTVPFMERNQPWMSSYLNQMPNYISGVDRSLPTRSSSQLLAPPGWSPWRTHFGGMNPLVQPATPSTSALLPNSPVAFRQYQLLNAQTSNNNGVYVQPHPSALVNTPNQNSPAQSQLSRLGPTSSSAMPLQLFGRNVVQNQNSGALVDNQEAKESLHL